MKTKLHGSSQVRDQFDPAEISSIHLIGCDGDDHLQIQQDVDIDATILGGDGNDHIFGGAGRDLLVGGFGQDWYFANSSTDTVWRFLGEAMTWRRPRAAQSRCEPPTQGRGRPMTRCSVVPVKTNCMAAPDRTSWSVATARTN